MVWLTVWVAAVSLPGCATVADRRAAAEAGTEHVRAQNEGEDAGPVTPPAPAPSPIPDPTPAPTASAVPGTATAVPPANATAPTVRPRAGAPANATDNPSLRGLSTLARNRAAKAVEPDEDIKLTFPDVRDDPLGKSGIPREERDPFLFPWLMNLIVQDRWRLEDDPVKGRDKRLRRQSDIDIRDPDPDTANFPNGAYTLPKGRLYIETSPVGFYGPSKAEPRIYQWEYLIRYGLTDNLEFRIFSNGLTAQAKPQRTTGFSPLAFDFKMHFWEENTKYFIPAMGVEIYIQTTFGSPAFNAGTQPSMNLLFDQSLPLGIGFEYNFGMAGVQNGIGRIHYQFSFQWSFQHEVVKDFDVFVHGFYNEAALPRLIQFRALSPAEAQSLISKATIPTVNVVGVGYIWTVNDRLAVFGSYNFGTTPASPATIALMGFAVAF
jgi:hypothetical protein